MGKEYPSPAWLQEAMVYPDDCLLPARLKGAVVQSQIMGLPALFTGANSAVFKITLDEKPYALKCFTKNDRFRNRRYRKLRKAIPLGGQSPFVDFEYFRKGIQFKNSKLPVMIYPWLDLPSIASFIEGHLEEPELLKRLATAILELEEYLCQREFAHGDLQHGNILIEAISQNKFKVHLIDYDQLFCHALRRVGIAEIGHRNYQHPDRNTTHFNSSMDRFSFISIWLAIQALIERPSLWNTFSNGENLLFVQNDYLHTKNSKLFQELSSLQEVGELVRVFSSICDLPLKHGPSLKDFVKGKVKINSEDKIVRKIGEDVDSSRELLSTDSIEKSLVGLRKERENLLIRLERYREEKEGKAKTAQAKSEGEYQRRYLQKQSVGQLETERVVSHKVVVRLKSFNLRNASDINKKSLDAIFGLAPDTKLKILEWVDRTRSEAPVENNTIHNKEHILDADLNLKRIENDISQVEERIESLEIELKDITNAE